MRSNVLVCNLTRFGDLIQTQPLIDDISKAGHKVSLLCLENFAAAASLMRGIDSVWPLPGAALLGELNSAWQKAAARLRDFTRSIVATDNPAYAINLTPTLSARLLTSIIGRAGVKTHGFDIDSHGFGINDTVWASFVAVAARKRMNAPFNLADMMRRMALPVSGNLNGDFQLAKPAPAAMAWSREFLGDNAGGFVAFQTGASERRRRWPLENFQALGRFFWRQKGIMPVLVGSSSEIALGERYAREAGHPFVNAIGKTDLPRLAAILSSCRLLVTNDTGTMHLAAGLNVPSLSFFLATAQPWDTGPLLPGCCCVEPKISCHPCAFNSTCAEGQKCRSIITAPMAMDLCNSWLNEGQWQVASDISAHCRVWLTARDEYGFSSVKPISGQENEPRTQWLCILRDFWSQLLDELANPHAHLPMRGTPLNYALQKSPQIANSLEQGIDILRSISACGPLAMQSRKGGELLLRNCERLQNLLDQQPSLNTLAAFWREFRQNQGADLEIFLPALDVFARHFENLATMLKDAPHQNV